MPFIVFSISDTVEQLQYVWHCLLVQGAQEYFYKIFLTISVTVQWSAINIIFARPMAEVRLCKSLYQDKVKLGVKEMEIHGSVCAEKAARMS